MTESQKTLGQIIAFINRHAPSKVDEIASAIKEMNKLVDKATMKKLLEEEIGNIIHIHCPNCKRVVTHETEGGRRYITKHNYCHKCGQALDWSES